MNQVLAERCQGKCVLLERPKTRMTEIKEMKEFEGEVKKKQEVSSLTRLGEQVEPKLEMKAMRSRLGDFDLKNSQGAPGTLGLGVSALHVRLLSQPL